MHSKQQNNLSINTIWTMENFQQEASSGSLSSSHPVLGNKKSVYQEKCQSNFAFWLACKCTCTVAWRKARNTNFFWWLLCCLQCFLVSGWPDEKWKICLLCNSDFNLVNIDNGKAEFEGGLQWLSHNHITMYIHNCSHVTFIHDNHIWMTLYDDWLSCH